MKPPGPGHVMGETEEMASLIRAVIVTARSSGGVSTLDLNLRRSVEALIIVTPPSPYSVLPQPFPSSVSIPGWVLVLVVASRFVIDRLLFTTRMF